MNKKPIILLILLMAPLAGIGIDIYSPSLPAIVNHFHVHMSLVKLTIPVYLVSYGIGHLVFGTLSDSFGRKKMLISGVILYILISVFITFSINIYWLLGLRMFQGFAVAAPGVMFKSLTADCFQEKQLQKIMAYVGVAWALGPILAPFIGGYLQFYFGWWASFYLLAIYGVVILIIALFFMPETNKNPVKLNVTSIIRNYKTILSNKLFIVGVVGIAAIYSMLVIFNIVGPFLIQDVLHYSAIDYGHIALLLGVFGFLGAFSNRFFINIASLDKIILFTCNCAFIISLLMVVASMWQLNLIILIVPICVIFYSISAAAPNFHSIWLSQFPELAGSASALMGFLFMIFTFIITSLASFLKSNTQLPLAIAYCVLTAICLFLCFCFLFRKKTL